MKEKAFRKLDSLDKFLTIYLKILDNNIATSSFKDLIKIYIEEKRTILSVVEFIRCIDKLSDKELEKQLKEFEADEELNVFVQSCVSAYKDEEKYLNISDEELIDLLDNNLERLKLKEADDIAIVKVDKTNYVALKYTVDNTKTKETIINELYYIIERVTRIFKYQERHLFIYVKDNEQLIKYITENCLKYVNKIIFNNIETFENNQDLETLEYNQLEYKYDNLLKIENKV